MLFATSSSLFTQYPHPSPASEILPPLPDPLSAVLSSMEEGAVAQAAQQGLVQLEGEVALAAEQGLAQVEVGYARLL